MDEFEIIRRYFTPRKTGKRVIVGVGDDGAVIRPRKKRDLIAVVDTLVAGVHYPLDMSAEDIGCRAVAVNVSDIAAMGGKPRWMTVSLTTDEDAPAWFEALANGLQLTGDRYGIDLVGGDMTRGSQTVISVNVIGDVRRGRALTRSGAKKGDSIYVSGYPGDAAAGLSILQGDNPGDRMWAANDYLMRRFANPDVRLELGQALAGVASAAIDVSDGLYADLEKLLAASGVSGVIDVDRVPLSEALQKTVGQEAALEFALGGGDDYELCFTSSDKSVVEIGARLGIPVTRIGKVKKGSGLRCEKGGERFSYASTGYRHF
jgi:thiamine-monophosphate kinase